MVGQLVAEQEKRGRPAYFIFMSDNGMSWGQKSEPFKLVPTSTRLPFYVKGPGVSRNDSYHNLSIIDIAPTIAQIAGAQMPWAQGESFLPVLKGQNFPRCKVHLEMMHKEPGDRKWFGWKGLRNCKWFYFRRDSGKRELYAYRGDQWYQRSLAKKYPGLVRKLNARLNRLVEESKTHPKFN
jgi:arylsulfatase A-like enzyme